MVTAAVVLSSVERAVSGLELTLILDNTLSMAGDSPTDLKTAANSLLDILFGDKALGEKLYVGIVPFSQAVNIGAAHSDWLAPNSLNWGPTQWVGCVEARQGGFDITDDVPTTRAFAPYYWEDGSGNDWIKSNGSYKSNLGQSLGPNKDCLAEVTVMTPVKSKLVSAIQAMNAVGYACGGRGLGCCPLSWDEP